jgi:hypothetical protein
MLIALAGMWLAGCRKTDYPVVNSPAYLRVFNCLTYNVTIETKDAPQPFLTMLVDPKLNENGAPVDAAITCDFLDTRGPLARPYPDAGNTALWQKEFPGTAKVAVGPIVNGYDLSSYAQVASGKHRFMFMTRPRSNDPFYSLNDGLRKNVLVDTTINLTEGEVYTMNVLELSAYTRKTGVYLRQEQFTKMPFSDSMVYVNFYNLSSEGFYATYPYDPNNGPFNIAIHDSMGVYYSLFRDEGYYGAVIQGYVHNFMTTVIRSQTPEVHPYFSFPLFPEPQGSHIFAGNAGQVFYFALPGTPPERVEQGTNSDNHGTFTSASVGPVHPTTVFGLGGDVRTGLAVTIHSGIYNPRSFATINTIEYINGNMYLTMLQRRYDPPTY